MYQQQTPQPRDEQNWSNGENEYEAGYAGNVQQTNQMADAIARRLQSQVPSSLQSPLYRHPGTVTAGMRLALAIVSVGALIPLAAITLSALGAFAGLIGLGVISAALVIINIVFSLR
jgi:hypothetical protein